MESFFHLFFAVKNIHMFLFPLALFVSLRFAFWISRLSSYTAMATLKTSYQRIREELVSLSVELEVCAGKVCAVTP